jgi:hypothetical protein
MSRISASASRRRSARTDAEGGAVRVYEPRMVRLVGAQGAMAFSQIKYWLNLSNGGKDYDGYHWIYKSARELGDEIGLSESQTKRALSKLCSTGVLVSIGNPEARWDRTLWYRIDYDHDYLQDTDLSPAKDESGPCGDDSVSSTGQRRAVDGPNRSARKRNHGSAIPETTTTESPHENPSDSSSFITPQEHAQDSLLENKTDEQEDRTVLPTKGRVRRGLPKPELSQTEANPQLAPTDPSDRLPTTPDTSLERLESDEPQTPQERLDAIRATWGRTVTESTAP